MSDTPTMLQDRLASMANEFSDEYRKLAVRMLAADVGKLERELTEARTRIKELADIGGALAEPLELQDCKCSDCRQWRRAVKDWDETVKRCLEGIE